MERTFFARFEIRVTRKFASHKYETGCSVRTLMRRGRRFASVISSDARRSVRRAGTSVSRVRALQIRRALAFAAPMADEYALNAVVEHVRPFTHVLSALRLSKKQLVRVGVSDRGVTFVAVDDSKSLQAQANFRAETFAAFSANPAAAFSTHDRSARAAIASSAFFDVSLGALIDVLNVFAPLDGETTVSIRWPDRDGKLVLAAAAERDGARPSDAPTSMALQREAGGTHSLLGSTLTAAPTTSAAPPPLLLRTAQRRWTPPARGRRTRGRCPPPMHGR